MNFKRRSKKGFTLIELVMVIVVLGFLAVAALPQYFDLTISAQRANEDGVVGGVRAGIATQFVSAFSSGIGTPAFPALLGTAAVGACVASNPCFATVLPGSPISDGNWSKTAVSSYTGPASGTYTYTSATGAFVD